MPRPFGRFVAAPAADPRARAGLWPTRPRAADPSRPVSSSGNGPRFLYPAWLMALEIQLRTIGDVAILACRGRLVGGPETSELDRCVRDLQEMRQRYVVVDVHEVPFVDSAGLGLLVRLLSRLRASGGDLTLCGATPTLQNALRVTRLHTVIASYDGEADAIAAMYRPDDDRDKGPAAVDILCVHPSSDVLAYTRQLLRQAGYGVVTATNRSDALTLLRATMPRVLVIDAAAGAAWSGGLPDGVHVVELPSTFATLDAGVAGPRLLTDVARAAAAGR